jgi:hypothetical protein
MARIYGALGFWVSNTLDAGMGGLTLNIVPILCLAAAYSS